jgi:hypothetical protein
MEQFTFSEGTRDGFAVVRARTTADSPEGGCLQRDVPLTVLSFFLFCLHSVVAQLCIGVCTQVVYWCATSCVWVDFEFMLVVSRFFTHPLKGNRCVKVLSRARAFVIYIYTYRYLGISNT